jgi:tRNA A-37 threonylcarbamoyl transferase component Bud32
MLELSRANLERIRRLLDGLEAHTPLLNGLLQRALQGQGEVLRISPQRSVFQIEMPDPEAPSDGSDLAASANSWLLKICHPARDWEYLRRLVSTPPVLRELENWQLLAARLDLKIRCQAQQLRPQLGIFARPFFQGTPAMQVLSERTDDLASGLAKLHSKRWSDRDLDANDLLFADDFDGHLIPLDLGQARLGIFPLAAELVYRDLARLLSGLDPGQMEALASPLLNAHHQAQMLPSWTSEVLLRRARRIRQRRTWQHSARCLRTTSDFIGSANQARRRSFVATPPLHFDSANVLSSGPRSTTLRTADVCWKMYPRPGLGQGIRKGIGLGPGRLAYRRLYWLELLGLPAARVQAWQLSGDAEWVANGWIDGQPLRAKDYPDLARYLARLHRNGVSMRDPKPANFLLNADRQIVLVDADGLRNHSLDRERDLARILAECTTGTELESDCLHAYLAAYQGSSKSTKDSLNLPRLQRQAQTFRLRLV